MKAKIPRTFAAGNFLSRCNYICKKLFFSEPSFRDKIIFANKNQAVKCSLIFLKNIQNALSSIKIYFAERVFLQKTVC